MKEKIYVSPLASFLDVEDDVITTSDTASVPEIGTETPPVDSGSGSWETL